MPGSEYILEMNGITKIFPGVKALDNVHFNLKAGEIHALVGENGAGKSTFIKTLTGVHQPDGGEIILNGEKVVMTDPITAQERGIAAIYQHAASYPDLSVAENIFIGHEFKIGPFIDWPKMNREAKKLLDSIDANLSPTASVGSLTVGQQQLVEIAKALSKNVKLLILDEPTSALNEDDSANLLELMRELKRKDITCIMISHKLNEIAAISDAVTVIRDGRTVETYPVEAGKVDEDRIIRSMVGRAIENRYPPHESHPGEIVFEVSDWCVEDPNVPGRLVCKNSSFNVRSGEVVGFAGLMGAGRTELMRSIFGHNYGIFKGGCVKLKGKELKLSSVSATIEAGIAYVPEDRKNLGLNLLDSIRMTIVSANLKAILRGRLLDSDLELQYAEDSRKALRIKTSSVDAGVTTLSGGNQQKVVLGKWMFTQPEVLILDEPTRGIDVGAKYEIYRLIHEMADQGKAVILVSSELPELLGMSDRIYTICEGRVTGEIDSRDADQEKLMRLMTTTSDAKA